MSLPDDKENKTLELMLSEVQQLKNLFRQKLEELTGADKKLDSLQSEIVKARGGVSFDPAKYEYLTSLGHEMRLPLNKLAATCDLLLNSQLNEKQKLYAQTIRAHARTLSEIINDVALFVKLESGAAERHESSFAPMELIEGCAQLFSKKATEKNLMLMTYASPTAPLKVYGDPVRIRKILQNLIDNAVKFTTQGEIVLSVTGKLTEGGDRFVEFAVSDTGSGIPHEIEGHLFHPFDRPSNRSSLNETGSGLGLAICHTLVKSMGGEIGIRQNHPRGTIFWFTLPLAWLKSAGEKDDDSGLGNMKLLLVNGEAGVAQILQSYADSWNIACLSVASKEEALKKILQQIEEGNPFDIVISEHPLPDGDAFTLMNEIKEKAKVMTPKVILLTSYHDDDLSNRHKPAGFSAYLTTPVTQSDVFDCLASVLMQTAQ